MSALGDEAKDARKTRGWVTVPFITGSVLGLSLAFSGSTSNFIVYLIKQFNVGSVDAAQIFNIILGCTSLSPIAGAILSDSFFGCFPVVTFSTVVSLFSMILFTLTATVSTLRPTPCAAGSSICETPSTRQLAVLYTAVAFMAVGTGGTRFNSITMGADQFDEAKDQDVFINWYFVTLYGSSIVGATAIVYVEDSVSWGLGFGLCTVANAVAVLVLLLGTRYYRRPKARGSPFRGLARVVVAAVWKRRKFTVAPESTNYYYGPDEGGNLSRIPTRSFRCLNNAALITEGDVHADGSIARPWRLCTVEQVEDLKTLIRIAPLWTSSIFLSVSIGIQGSLSVLQALTMDRSLGSHFSIPAGSITVSSLAATALFLPLFDRVVFPAYHQLIGRSLTPLQRIGAGQLLNAFAMAASAMVERARASVVRAHHAAERPGWIVPMSALWLVPPLVVTGVAEGLHFPGQVALYYQEFPTSLRSTATGMIAVLVALGFYLSTAAVELVRRLTGWLPDNINQSRMENVYWMLVVVGVLNFGYYLICARMYEYQRKADQKIATHGSDVPLAVE